MLKCRKCAVRTPIVYYADASNHLIFMERLTGLAVRDQLSADKHPWKGILIQLYSLCPYLNMRSAEVSWKLCARVGATIAKMHDNEIIHGDLTTSNLIYLENEETVVCHANNSLLFLFVVFVLMLVFSRFQLILA